MTEAASESFTVMKLNRAMLRHHFHNLIATVLFVCAGPELSAVEQGKLWSVASPNGKCSIELRLNPGGKLTYSVSRNGIAVLKPSPLGLIRDDESFESGLTFRSAEKPMPKREQYQLFSGPKSQVDHVLNHRTIEFLNTNHASFKIELAAGDEGVAFRYHFSEPSGHSHEIRSELTGFHSSRRHQRLAAALSRRQPIYASL